MSVSCYIRNVFAPHTGVYLTETYAGHLVYWYSVTKGAGSDEGVWLAVEVVGQADEA